MEKEYKLGDDKEAYLRAKRNTRKTVYNAKRSTEGERFECINQHNGKNVVFEIGRRMKDNNKEHN